MNRVASGFAWWVLLTTSPLALAAQPEVPRREVAERSVRVAVLELAPGPAELSLPDKMGILEAEQEVSLSFEVAGRVESVLKEGATVAAGGTVAVLDSRLEEAELHRAELLLGNAVAELARVRGLQRSRAASERDLDAATTEVGTRRAEHSAAQERRARRELLAPFAGVVADVEVEPGQVTVPGEPIARLMDFDTLKLEVGVPGYQIRRVVPGAGVLVRVPAVPEMVFGGIVNHVAPAAADGGALFEVEIWVENKEAALKPGLSARARIVTDHLQRALALPLEATVQRNGSPVVFFVREDRAHAYPVGDAALQGDLLLLTADLPTGPLVIRGQHDLSDGVAVRIDNTIIADLESDRFEGIRRPRIAR